MFLIFIFIAMELLDIVITGIGIFYGLTKEINPIGISAQMIITKLIITVCVAGILYLKPKRKIDWIIPIIAGIPVLWNILNIIVEL